MKMSDAEFREKHRGGLLSQQINTNDTVHPPGEYRPGHIGILGDAPDSVPPTGKINRIATRTMRPDSGTRAARLTAHQGSYGTDQQYQKISSLHRRHRTWRWGFHSVGGASCEGRFTRSVGALPPENPAETDPHPTRGAAPRLVLTIVRHCAPTLPTNPRPSTISTPSMAPNATPIATFNGSRRPVRVAELVGSSTTVITGVLRTRSILACSYAAARSAWTRCLSCSSRRRRSYSNLSSGAFSKRRF